MITSADWLSPTRATGLMAYGTTVICCGIAWIRSKDLQASQLAALLALIESLLLLDIVFNWRWELHDFFAGIAKSHNEYAARRLPQTIVVSILGGILLLGLRATWWRFRGRAGAFLAVSGAVLSLVLWCVEMVSLHAVDHILYHFIGKWMVVSALWILACLMTSIGMLLFLTMPTSSTTESEKNT